MAALKPDGFIVAAPGVVKLCREIAPEIDIHLSTQANVLNYLDAQVYWETGMTQKHSVNVSGATDKVNYFAGISYFDQDGNLGKLNYNRWNYRAGVDVKVSKWLGANLTVSGDYATKEKPLVKVGGSGDEKDYNLLLTRPTYMPESVSRQPLNKPHAGNHGRIPRQYFRQQVIQPVSITSSL
jgi:hypothetical protein